MTLAESQGRIQPAVEGGSERAEGARKILGRYSRNYLVFLLNNAAVYMFPPHSERNTEKRVHLGQDKGAVLAKKRASTLSFHREEGGTAPICP